PFPTQEENLRLSRGPLSSKLAGRIWMRIDGALRLEIIPAGANSAIRERSFTRAETPEVYSRSSAGRKEAGQGFDRVFHASGVFSSLPCSGTFQPCILFQDLSWSSVYASNPHSRGA